MIDIVIPTYNSNSTLIRCLESIEAQDFLGSINVIIINDGGEQLPDLSTLDLNIKEVGYRENRGPGYARNYGLNMGKSEFITFIDSDDTITEDAIRLLITNIKDNSILVGLENKYDKEGNFESTYSMLNLHGKLYRRSIIENFNIRFPDFVYSAEDTAFNWLYQLCTSSPIQVLNIPIYNYYCTQDSIVNKSSLQEFYYSSNFRDSVQVEIWFLREMKIRNTSEEKMYSFKKQLFIDLFIYYKQGVLEDSLNLKAVNLLYREAELNKDEIRSAVLSRCTLDDEDKINLEHFINLFSE